MKTQIDSTTPATWAASILAKVREATTDGFGVCYDGAEYDLHNFLCDTWGGAMPWSQDKAAEVVALMEADPTFADTMAAFEAKYDTNFMDDSQ